MLYGNNVRLRAVERTDEKVGFRQEGVRRQAIYQDRLYHDAYWMAILRSEFDELAAF